MFSSDTTTMLLSSITFFLVSSTHALQTLIPKQTNTRFPDFFKIVETATHRGTTVLEAPVHQDGVNMYIAIDHESYQGISRPGNGGIRLCEYQSIHTAIDDAVRLAQGMTRKHDMFRTGFSGAKIVVRSEKLETVDRKALMQDAARALTQLDGTVYTGCDLNTGDADMDHLVQATGHRYVLAGRNSRVDTNVATANSVIGAILGVLDSSKESPRDIYDLTFTVQGCGKVGSIVAQELVALGAKCVQTCDVRHEAAQIPGCTPITDWTSTACDFLVPCANSLAITEQIASAFPAGIRYCVGATNSPFATPRAKAIFEDDRDVWHVPESISSAGAILADSVEWCDVKLYQTVEPDLMYGWIRDISRRKSSKLMNVADGIPANVGESVQDVVPSRAGLPVGEEFPDWIEANTVRTDTLIVGGGVAGTASAFSLAEQGKESVLIEQGESIAPASASSNGDSRMYRKMYSSEFFSNMQAQALERWKDVEKQSGQKLLQENGLLFYGEDTGETVEGSVLGAKETMDNLGLPYTFYKTGDDIADAYPSLEGCRGKPYSGVCEDTAGHIKASKGNYQTSEKSRQISFIFPSSACEAMVEAASEKCQVMLKTKLIALQPDVNGKVVATTNGGKSIIANNAILAPGPWTNQVLDMAYLPRLKLDVWMVQWAHYEVEGAIARTIPQAFHFRKASGIDGGLYYVFPASATESIENGKAHVKVGLDFPTGESLESMQSFSYEGSDEILALMDGWVEEHLPQVGRRVDSFCSPYTMTSDSYFVMDKIHPNVAIFSGGSGRAFKFGPLLGDCMASLVTEQEPPVDLENFSAHREALK